ncbi:MAG: penicillin-insensitive murein endopeptidase [Nannocystaceae bacterium]
MPRRPHAALAIAALTLLACDRGAAELPPIERVVASRCADDPEATPLKVRPDDCPERGPAPLDAAVEPAPAGEREGASPEVASTAGAPAEVSEDPAIPRREVDAAGGLPDVDENEFENENANENEEEDDDDAPLDEADPEAVWITHEVAPAETIRQLALRYRSDPGKIRAWNGLPAGAKARPGKRLRILAKRTPPPREKIRVTAGEEDTWARIGQRYGVDPSDLRAANVRRVGRRLDPGDELDVWYDPTIVAAIEGDRPPPGPAAEVRAGAYGIGRPQDGRLVNGARIPDSDAYELRYPGSAWGTTAAVRALVTALHSWRAQTGYAGRVTLGAMSRQRGRKIGGHLSHQTGRDVDVRLPLREALRQDLTPLGRRVDWWALWRLFVILEDTGMTRRIFLDYTLQKRLYKAAKEHGVPTEVRRKMIQFPRGPGTNFGLVRHSPGHDLHFHVRFRCAAYETECAG